MMSTAWAVIVASGKREKFGADFETAFLNLASKPVLAHVLHRYELCPEIEGVVVVVPKERIDHLRGMVHVFGYNKVKKIVAGSNQRLASVLAGLAAVDEAAEFVSIHDGSRPCLAAADIVDTLKSARRYGSGVLAVPIDDAVKSTRKGSNIAKDVEADALWVAHTPQAFKVAAIRKALLSAQKKKVALVDESEAMALIGEEVRLVAATGPRVRIASPSDIHYAEVLLRN